MFKAFRGYGGIVAIVGLVLSIFAISTMSAAATNRDTSGIMPAAISAIPVTPIVTDSIQDSLTAYTISANVKAINESAHTMVASSSTEAICIAETITEETYCKAMKFAGYVDKIERPLNAKGGRGFL